MVTRDDIICMARKAGFTDSDLGMGRARILEDFAALVAAAEREACAKVLDEMADDMAREMEPSTAIAYVRLKAATIRARGETK